VKEGRGKARREWLSLNSPQTQTEAPRDGPRPRSAHWVLCSSSTPCGAARLRPIAICFDASSTVSFRPPRPSFVGPSTSRSRGHDPPLAPNLTGFPAGLWILGPPRRSSSPTVALAALRSVFGFRRHRPVQGVRRVTFSGALGFPVCAGTPDARESMRTICHQVEIAESLVHRNESGPRSSGRL
jgi:hypothetical protein